MRARLKIKRGVEGGAAPLSGGLGGRFFAHLLSKASSFRLCLKHRIFRGTPPLFFFAPLFSKASSESSGAPRSVRLHWDLCLSTVRTRLKCAILGKLLASSPEQGGVLGIISLGSCGSFHSHRTQGFSTLFAALEHGGKADEVLRIR